HGSARLAPVATGAAVAAVSIAAASASRSVAAGAALGRSRFARLQDALARAVPFGPLGEREQLATRDLNLALAVHRDDLDLHLVPFLQHVLDPLHAFVGELG